MVVKNTAAELKDNDVTSGGEPAEDTVVANASLPDPGDAEGPNEAVAQPVQEAMSSSLSVPSEPVDDAARWELNYTPKYKIRREKFNSLAICWHLKQDDVDRRRRMGVLLRVALAVFEVQAVLSSSIADGDYLAKFVQWLDTYGDDKLIQHLKWALDESEWQPTGECEFEVSDLVLMCNTLTRDHAFYEPNVAELVRLARGPESSVPCQLQAPRARENRQGAGRPCTGRRFVCLHILSYILFNHIFILLCKTIVVPMYKMPSSLCQLNKPVFQLQPGLIYNVLSPQQCRTPTVSMHAHLPSY